METCTECGTDIDPAHDEFTCSNGRYVCVPCEDEATAEGAENVNCLQGMRCPHCKALEPFRIEISTTIVVWDDGSDPHTTDGNLDWADGGYCKCMTCDYEATVADFRAKKDAA